MEYWINMYMRGGMIQTISDIPHYAQSDALEEIDDWDGHKGHEYLHTVHFKDGAIAAHDYSGLVAEMLANHASERRHIAIAAASLRASQ